MSTPRLLPILLCSLLSAPLSAQDSSPGLGQAVEESALQGFDLIAPPDGSGFPAGGGTARQGRQVFATYCAACHGTEGEGTSGSTVLVGGNMQSTGTPLRTVGSYWPHASTVFDYIRRAMPANAPKSLSNEQVYQVTAYLLFLNGIIAEDLRLDRESLTRVRMPNADGFVDQSSIQ